MRLTSIASAWYTISNSEAVNNLYQDIRLICNHARKFEEAMQHIKAYKCWTFECLTHQ